jgi:sugar/nucleoside kinase (ribokinase family)
VSFDCLSVGILVADHLCTPIARLPDAGELVLADDLPLAIGGCAANVAIDLRRVGLSVGVVGCVGDDVFGQFIRDTLEATGADTDGIRRVTEMPTSGTLILNVAGQDRRFIHTIGASAALRAADIPWSLVEQCKVLYLGGYLLLKGLESTELAELFRKARAAGIVTVLDIVMPGPGDHLAQLTAVLRETDVFLPNTDEAASITGQKDPQSQAESFLNAGARTVVITCGQQGALLMSDSLRLRTGTYPTQFVGGTGAGDAFDAGYILGLVQQNEPRRCLEWGSALGASCVRSISATQSVFTRLEAQAFIDQTSLDIRAF